MAMLLLNKCIINNSYKIISKKYLSTISISAPTSSSSSLLSSIFLIPNLSSIITSSLNNGKINLFSLFEHQDEIKTIMPNITDSINTLSPMDIIKEKMGMSEVNSATDIETLESLIGNVFNIKRTFQPSLRRRKSKHGFLHRIRSKDGIHVLNRRRRKGRRNLCA